MKNKALAFVTNRTGFPKTQAPTPKGDGRGKRQPKHSRDARLPPHPQRPQRPGTGRGCRGRQGPGQRLRGARGEPEGSLRAGGDPIPIPVPVPSARRLRAGRCGGRSPLPPPLPAVTRQRSASRSARRVKAAAPRSARAPKSTRQRRCRWRVRQQAGDAKELGSAAAMARALHAELSARRAPPPAEERGGGSRGRWCRAGAAGKCSSARHRNQRGQRGRGLRLPWCSAAGARSGAGR